MDNSSSLLRQRLRGWVGQLKPILLALGFVLIVRTVVAEPYQVPSPSMVPTLLVGDQLVATKFAYGYSKYSSPIGLMPDFSGRLLGKTPERGDVVVFRLPRDPSTTYVKRLIGLPGDRIQMQGGRLYINDAIVPRRAIGRSRATPADAARRPSTSRRCRAGASTRSSRCPTPTSTTTRRSSSCRPSTTS